MTIEEYKRERSYLKFMNAYYNLLKIIIIIIITSKCTPELGDIGRSITNL